MDDDLDPRIERRFADLDLVEPPDTWPSAVSPGVERIAGNGARRRHVRAVAIAAAAGVLVVSGVVAVWARAQESDAPPPAASVLPPSEPTSAPPPPFGDADIEPAAAAPGERVTITPTQPVRRTCSGGAVVRSGADRAIVGVLARDGGWFPADGDPTPRPACLPPRSADPVSYVVPSELTDGAYVLCLTDAELAAGCATFQVDRATPTTTRDASATAIETAIAVQTIEVHTNQDGGEDIVFIFDGQLPDDRVTFAQNIDNVDAPGIAYTVQDPSALSVCDDRHFNPAAATGSIDVLIPSEWWSSGAPVHEVPLTWVPPLDSNGDSIDSPGKIVGCGPYMGYIQYSIWAPASDDADDIQVSVQDGATRLVVAVRP